MKNDFRARLAVAVVLAAVVFSNSSAATQIWNGSANNQWATPTNWSGGTVPTSVDTAMFSTTSTFSCSLTANATVNSLIFTTGYSGKFDFGGHVLSVSATVDFRYGAGAKIQQIGNDTLILNGSTSQTIFPPPHDTLPVLLNNSSGPVSIGLINDSLIVASYVGSGPGTFTLGSPQSLVTISNCLINGGTLNASTGSLYINGDVTLILEPLPLRQAATFT